MNRIKDLRKELGLTQKQLAMKIGVSDASINKYEKGTMSPKIDKLEAMASLFDVSIDYLTGKSNLKISREMRNLMLAANSSSDSDTSFFKTEDEKEVSLLYDYRKLNEEGKKEARKQVLNLTKISDYTK